MLSTCDFVRCPPAHVQLILSMRFPRAVFEDDEERRRCLCVSCAQKRQRDILVYKCTSNSKGQNVPRISFGSLCRAENGRFESEFRSLSVFPKRFANEAFPKTLRIASSNESMFKACLSSRLLSRFLKTFKVQGFRVLEDSKFF